MTSDRSQTKAPPSGRGPNCDTRFRLSNKPNLVQLPWLFTSVLSSGSKTNPASNPSPALPPSSPSDIITRGDSPVGTEVCSVREHGQISDHGRPCGSAQEHVDLAAQLRSVSVGSVWLSPSERVDPGD